MSIIRLPIYANDLDGAGQPCIGWLEPEHIAQILGDLPGRLAAVEKAHAIIADVKRHTDACTDGVGRFIRDRIADFEQQDAKPPSAIAGGDPSLCLIHGTEQQDAKPCDHSFGVRSIGTHWECLRCGANLGSAAAYCTVTAKPTSIGQRLMDGLKRFGPRDGYGPDFKPIGVAQPDPLPPGHGAGAYFAAADAAKPDADEAAGETLLDLLAEERRLGVIHPLSPSDTQALVNQIAALRRELEQSDAVGRNNYQTLVIAQDRIVALQDQRDGAVKVMERAVVEKDKALAELAVVSEWVICGEVSCRGDKCREDNCTACNDEDAVYENIKIRTAKMKEVRATLAAHDAARKGTK